MKILLAAAVLALSVDASAQSQRRHLSGCGDAQKAAAATAAGEAMRRLWNAKMAVSGIGMALGEAARYEIARKQARAEAYQKAFFGESETDTSFYVTSMYVGLMEHNADIRCSSQADKECGAMREAYVRSSERRVIHLCPGYFSKTGKGVDLSAEKAEQRVRTLIHEAAHSAGISESSGGESYCVHFDCESSCGDGGGKGKGANVADNWSQFVHCAAGRPADRLQPITASAP